MDAIYYTASNLMVIIFLALIVLTIILLVRPHLLNNRKVVKKPFSRLKILLVGIAMIVLTLFSFGSVMAATEPLSVKQARAEAAAKAEATKTADAAAKQKLIDDSNAALKKQQEEDAKPQVKTETKTESVPFESTTQQTSSLSKGVTNISVHGVNGQKMTTYSVTYVKGVETKREVVKEEITTQPVTQVTQVGTYVAPASSGSSNSDCNPNYSGCVPNVSYDLNCPDIGYKVKVLGYDQYHLDADHDGYGCDSY